MCMCGCTVGGDARPTSAPEPRARGPRASRTRSSPAQSPRAPRGGVVADQRPRTHRIGHWEFDESLRMFSHRRRYLARIHTLQSAVTTPCTTAPYTREDVTVVTTTRAALAKTDRERNAAHRATNSSPNLECTRRSNYALRTATPRSARLLLLSRLFLLLGVVKAAVGRAVEQVVVPIERSRLHARGVGPQGAAVRARRRAAPSCCSVIDESASGLVKSTPSPGIIPSSPSSPSSLSSSAGSGFRAAHSLIAA